MSVLPGGGLPNHRRIIKDFPGVLDVVAVVSNPCRYRSRYDLYRAFERHMLDSGVRLTTVEMAFGGREFEVTESGNPRHVQVRSSFELWHKENLIRLGVSRLPSDWASVAWIDADVQFARSDWCQETLHALQHYSVVQPWSQVIEVTPDFESYDTGMGLVKHSFCSQYQRAIAEGHLASIHPCFGSKKTSAVLSAMTHKGLELRVPDETKYGAELLVGEPYGAKLAPHPDSFGAEAPKPIYKTETRYFHPGFAWACTREAWDTFGGLIDKAILGAADHSQAWALIGMGEKSFPKQVSRGYRNMVMNWAERASKLTGNIGYVPGTLTHFYHGNKIHRKYTDRWKILIETGFDPDLDLQYDWQGLLMLTGRNPRLRDLLRTYFAERREDDSFPT